MRSIPEIFLPIALTMLISSAVAESAPFDTSWPGSTPELFAPAGNPTTIRL